jgi:hypothetical protein
MGCGTGQGQVAAGRRQARAYPYEDDTSPPPCPIQRRARNGCSQNSRVQPFGRADWRVVLCREAGRQRWEAVAPGGHRPAHRGSRRWGGQAMQGGQAVAAEDTKPAGRFERLEKSARKGPPLKCRVDSGCDISDNSRRHFGPNGPLPTRLGLANIALKPNSSPHGQHRRSWRLCRASRTRPRGDARDQTWLPQLLRL